MGWTIPVSGDTQQLLYGRRDSFVLDAETLEAGSWADASECSVDQRHPATKTGGDGSGR